MAGIVLALGWVAVTASLVLGGTFLTGHWRTAHRLDQLPLVLATRYTALAALGGAILLARDIRLLAVFFAVAALLAASDAWIYRRTGPVWMHLAAAGGGGAAFLLCLLAIFFSP